MNNPIPSDAGWLLDDYDAEDFWSRVSYQGGFGYRTDPLVDQVRVTGQCWTWKAAKDGTEDGAAYGMFSIWGRKHRAHRIAFRDFGNKIAEDQVVDHLCRNTLCVRPSHLEAVSQTENIRRGRQPLLNRGICRNGHEMTPENLVRRKRGNKVVNACKTCLTASKRRTYLRRKAEGKV